MQVGGESDGMCRDRFEPGLPEIDRLRAQSRRQTLMCVQCGDGEQVIFLGKPLVGCIALLVSLVESKYAFARCGNIAMRSMQHTTARLACEKEKGSKSGSQVSAFAPPHVSCPRSPRLSFMHLCMCHYMCTWCTRVVALCLHLYIIIFVDLYIAVCLHVCICAHVFVHMYRCLVSKMYSCRWVNVQLRICPYVYTPICLHV